MEEILKTITDIVQEYESGAWKTPEKLRVLNRLLTSNILYLTKFQLDYRRKWQEVYYNSTASSVAAKERWADEQVPEVYMCRKIIEAAKGVSISMTGELQVMKNE